MKRIIISLLLLILNLPQLGAAVDENHQTLPNPIISLDFQDIPIRTALQQLAKLAGINLLIDDQVQANITLHLKMIPAQEALSTMLKMQGLEKQMLGLIWIIAPQGVLWARQKEALDIKEQRLNLGTLQSKHISLRYRDAKDIAELFLKQNTTSPSRPGRQLNIDQHSNSLWIRDTALRIQALKEMVQALDHPLKQILIKARIVTIDKSFEQELGIRFGITESPHLMSGSLDGANQLAMGQQAKDVPISQRLNIDLPVTGPAISLGLALAKLGSDKLLDLELSALESAGGGQIISSPQLMTTDRSSAIIEAGSEIPYQEKLAKGATSVAFKKAVLSLKVTPQITQDQRLLLKLQVNHDKPSALLVQEAPAIDTRSLQTQVFVASGETIVLGGIYERLNNRHIKRIPFLGRLPLLGSLFTHRAEQEKIKELLIFVTPYILS